MFPIHKKLELQWHNFFFLFIYLLIYIFIYFRFCLACQKVYCNKKALKILDHTYHLPLLKCYLFIDLFFLKYSTV